MFVNGPIALPVINVIKYFFLDQRNHWEDIDIANNHVITIAMQVWS